MALTLQISHQKSFPLHLTLPLPRPLQQQLQLRPCHHISHSLHSINIREILVIPSSTSLFATFGLPPACPQMLVFTPALLHSMMTCSLFLSTASVYYVRSLVPKLTKSSPSAMNSSPFVCLIMMFDVKEKNQFLFYIFWTIKINYGL